MKIEPISAAMNAPTRGSSPASSMAAAVPTSTGAIAAGSVRGRAAISQILKQAPLGPLGVLGEVRAAPLLVGIAPLLSLLAHVEEESRIVGELLDPGDPVLVRIEARLQQSQRQWGERRHLAAPGDRLALEPVERNDRVDQAHVV